jgi:hypothetical protein
MTPVLKIRPIIFAIGIAAILLSLSIAVASYLRPVDTPDYLKQAQEAVPWAQVGLFSGATGLLFSFWGRKWWRFAAIGTASLVLVWWCLITESLF